MANEPHDYSAQIATLINDTMENFAEFTEGTNIAPEIGMRILITALITGGIQNGTLLPEEVRQDVASAALAAQKHLSETNAASDMGREK